MKPRPLAERFWGKINKNGPVHPVLGTQCWVWTAGRDKQGYGHLRVDGADRRAHRIAWTLAFGPIPVGVDVLHHCDNPPCGRPDHLFLGTQADNTADMLAKGREGSGPRKTHCPQGHEYTPGNTHVYRGRKGWMQRSCITCSQADGKAKYAKDRPKRIANAAKNKRLRKARDPEGERLRHNANVRAYYARLRKAG